MYAFTVCIWQFVEETKQPGLLVVVEAGVGRDRWPQPVLEAQARLDPRRVDPDLQFDQFIQELGRSLRFGPHPVEECGAARAVHPEGITPINEQHLMDPRDGQAGRFHQSHDERLGEDDRLGVARSRAHDKE
jgi:hypothetical protein